MREPDLTIDVIIPTYKPDEKFDLCMERLAKQTIVPNHIYIINTEEQYMQKDKYKKYKNVTITHITKEAFDHGGTRNKAVRFSSSDIVLLMTQDAIPTDNHLIKEILRPFEEGNIAAVYARQLPVANAGMIEQYTRQFNYPEESTVKSKEDLERLGIKTYFCSNVCCAYRRELYEKLGGFVTKTIFNEDMIMAFYIIGAGYQIAYSSKAKVIHSHKYNYWQQFTRNFDLAVSQKQYAEIFSTIKSEKEGIKLVKGTINYLVQNGKWYLIPDLMMQSGFKFLGYKLGCHYNKIPRKIVIFFSMNKTYWSKTQIENN